MPVQSPHEAHPRKHRRAAVLGNQNQRVHGGLPFRAALCSDFESFVM
jgi:hypothetical protein